MTTGFDYVLVGMGLQNALIVLGLAALRPGSRVALVERAALPFGNHTWCFHAGDLPAAAHAFVAPAVAVSWPGYRVCFPDYERKLAQPYAAVTVPSLSAAVARALDRLDASLYFGRVAEKLSATHVTLADGTRLEGKLVVDARGPQSDGVQAVGYQKFLGYELRLRKPVALSPIVMDARVQQIDGFRFVYVLPLASDRVLVEDTYYSTSKVLDIAAASARIFAYAEQHGFDVVSVDRQESGVLPLPARNAIPADDLRGPLLAGYRGGLFHPVTGYSFPLAARLALHLAEAGPLDARDDRLSALLADVRKQTRFLGFLNGLLFENMPDHARRNVLERFYRLPEQTIVRFYGLTLGVSDRARIVCGRPPRGFSLLQTREKREARFE